MKSHFEFAATARADMGKGASRRLRRQGLIPAIIYGAEKPAESITLEHNKVVHAAESESFYSSILKIKVGKGAAEEVIFKDIQRHPFKPKIMHLDFQRIQANVALHVHVPLHFVGAEKAVGVKEGGIISHLVNDVEISCLPRHLPEYLEINVLNLGLDETLHLSDIQLPEGVSIIALQGEDAHNLPVVAIHKPKAVVEETNEAPVAAEVPSVHGGAESADGAKDSKDSKAKKEG